MRREEVFDSERSDGKEWRKERGEDGEKMEERGRYHTLPPLCFRPLQL
jgi:hypothetical protein